VVLTGGKLGNQLLYPLRVIPFSIPLHLCVHDFMHSCIFLAAEGGATQILKIAYYLDTFIKHKLQGKYYNHYVDDIVVLGNYKKHFS